MLAEVRERNQEYWQQRLQHEAMIKDIERENERRIAQSESDYQDALQRFEEEVGGEEAAAELLAGKAEWRENKWAWREYIDMINTATVDAGHLARLKRRVLEDRVTVNELTLAQTNIDAQTVGAVQWEGDRPNPREKILGIRRELGRAMAEWVMAVEEVKVHNERLEEGARVQHAAQSAAAKRSNQRRAAAAEKLHAVEKAAVEKHNAGVQQLLPYVQEAESELRKVTIALEVLRDSMLQQGVLQPSAEEEGAVTRQWPAARAEGEELVMIKGDGRKGSMPLAKTLVPPVCLTQLLQVVAGETADSIKRMHAQFAAAPLHLPSPHAHPADSRARQRAQSMPPGRRKCSDYLHWLSAADCHLVPSGVSSSGLSGGGGGAARPTKWRGSPRPHGYTWKNDAPLAREEARKLLPRAPNRRALDTKNYFGDRRIERPVSVHAAASSLAAKNLAQKRKEQDELLQALAFAAGSGAGAGQAAGPSGAPPTEGPAPEEEGAGAGEGKAKTGTGTSKNKKKVQQKTKSGKRKSVTRGGGRGGGGRGRVGGEGGGGSARTRDEERAQERQRAERVMRVNMRERKTVQVM